MLARPRTAMLVVGGNYNPGAKDRRRLLLEGNKFLHSAAGTVRSNDPRDE